MTDTPTLRSIDVALGQRSYPVWIGQTEQFLDRKSVV